MKNTKQNPGNLDKLTEKFKKHRIKLPYDYSPEFLCSNQRLSSKWEAYDPDPMNSHEFH